MFKKNKNLKRWSYGQPYINIYFVPRASVVADFIVVVFVVAPIPNIRITVWRQKFPFLTVKNFVL